MFKKAVKTQAKLRLALCGLAGSGKTYSALAIATEVARQANTKIAVIDSERGSASLYADKFDFDVCELESFSPLAYVEKIKAAEDAGYGVIVVDSLSHAWAGKDGALDQKDKATDRDPRANSWTAWRNVTPKHNALVDALVGSKSHLIATMRQKMEHVQETVNGRTEIKKVGLAAIQREGMEYEFTLVGDIGLDHVLKISKTRVEGIDVGDMFEKPGEAFARKVYGWLMSGAEPARPAAVLVSDEPPASTAASSTATSSPSTTVPAEPVIEPVAEVLDEVFRKYLEDIAAANDIKSLDKAATGPGKPAKGTPNHNRAIAAYRSRKAWLEQQVKQEQAAAS